MSQRWAPIVYGRTRHADMWWRVLPAGETEQGAVAGLVLATVGGGAYLDRGPRFVLGRGEYGVLVGVACDAAAISDTMALHGRRPLYTFVGWLGPVDGPVPPYEVWVRRWRESARRTYHDWVSLDWEKPKHEITGPHTGEPGDRPGWAEPLDGGSGEGAGAEPWLWRPTEPDAIWTVPEADAAAVWNAARVAEGPFCLTTGWIRSRRITPGRITHLCAHDVPEPDQVRGTPPAPPALSPAAHHRVSAWPGEASTAGTTGRPGVLKRIAEEVRDVVGRFLPTCKPRPQSPPPVSPRTLPPAPPLARPPERPPVSGAGPGSNYELPSGPITEAAVESTPRRPDRIDDELDGYFGPNRSRDRKEPTP